jgi:hypothetical protein
MKESLKSVLNFIGMIMLSINDKISQSIMEVMYIYNICILYIVVSNQLSRSRFWSGEGKRA